MAKIPVKNNGKNPLPVAGAMILPGETRHFEEQEVPPHLRPSAAGPEKTDPPADPVLALLDIKGGVKNIIPKLSELSDDNLARLKQAEQDGKTRDGLTKAIAVEELKRADAKAAGDEGDNTGGDDDADNGDDTGAQE